MNAAFQTYSTSKENSLQFFDADGNVFWFSYKTLIAFKPINGSIVCMQNYWKTTTGTHIKEIQPDKSKRVTQETFDLLYREAFFK